MYANENINLNFKSFSLQNLTGCYQQCANLTESLTDVTAVHEALNASFKLHCRDSKRLLIQVERSDDGHVENKTFIYLLIIQETKASFPDRIVYIVSFKSFTFAFRTFFCPCRRNIKLNVKRN